jgi:hypothetical protein
MMDFRVASSLVAVAVAVAYFNNQQLPCYRMIKVRIKCLSAPPRMGLSMMLTVFFLAVPKIPLVNFH